MKFNIKESLKKASIYFYILVLVVIAGGTFFSSDYLSKNEVKDAMRQLLKASEVSTGSNFYIDKENVGGNGCNDGWAGTLNQPFCTFTQAAKVVNPGDTVFFRRGSYPPILFTKSGAADKYITLSSFNSESVKIIGGDDGILLRGSSYIKIQGFDVSEAKGNWLGGIRLTANGTTIPTYNIIENNVVHDNLGTNTNGIVVEYGAYNSVINNKVYNNGLSGIIIVANYATTLTHEFKGNSIIGNTVYGNVKGGGNADGIKIEGKNVKENIVRDNISYGNGDDGIDTWDTPNNEIINNISYNQIGPGDGNGFKLGGSVTKTLSNGTIVKTKGGDNLILGNIAYGNKYNGFDSNGSGGNKFYHNVSYGNSSFGFEDGWKLTDCTVQTCKTTFINNIGYNNNRANINASSYTETSNNNLWFSDNSGAKASYNYSTHSTLASFYKASGNRLDNPAAGNLSSISLDPLFTNVANGDFTFKSGSPAIDKGHPDNPGQINYINVPDIGAKEFGLDQDDTSPPPTTQPSPTPSSTNSTPTPTMTPTPSPTRTPTPTPSPTRTPTPTPLTTNDTTGPVINITSPVAGTLVRAKNQKVNIKTSSSDSSGIYQTQIYFDNSSKPVKTCSSSSTCDTTIGKVSNGLHYIRVRSTDNSSNKNWSEVSISFSFSQ